MQLIMHEGDQHLVNLVGEMYDIFFELLLVMNALKGNFNNAILLIIEWWMILGRFNFHLGLKRDEDEGHYLVSLKAYHDLYQ